MATENKGPLRCYNQFARHYKHFDEMVAQLPAIRGMGFNAVWVSPLHPVSEIAKAADEPKDKPPQEDANAEKKTVELQKGSLYAMTDPWAWRSDFFGTSDVEEQKKMLKGYTQKAKELGLLPMFDLVLNHLGKVTLEEEDNRLSKNGQGGKNISHWFRDDTMVMDNGIKWDDVQPFKYSDEAVRKEVIENLWKPFVNTYINELGFEGMRIDAAHHGYIDVVKEMVRYANDQWKTASPDSPHICMAEVMGGDETQRKYLRMNDEELGITHITNYAYWLPNRLSPEQDKGAAKSYRDMTDQEFQDYSKIKFDGTNKGKGESAQVVRLTPDGKTRSSDIQGIIKGTVGTAYSHDEKSVVTMLKEAGFEGDIEKALREHIASAALFSDGGWIGGTGLETADSRRPSVFDSKDNQSPPDPKADMVPFIREINAIVAKQPALHLFNWTDRLFLDGKPQLLILNTHNGDANDTLEPHEQHSYLKIVNTDPKQEVTLSKEDVEKLAQLTGKEVADFKPATSERNGVFYAGGVKVQQPQLYKKENIKTQLA